VMISPTSGNMAVPASTDATFIAQFVLMNHFRWSRTDFPIWRR
jgi:hypothetical protein